MKFEFSKDFADEMDQKDPLSGFREQFYIPEKNGEPVVYFTGNSLGLQPKTAKQLLMEELEDWAQYGVEGHFAARRPWYSYHELFSAPLSRLVGALPEEVVAMNALTVNLHLMMVSFYRPDKKRYKIVCEEKAFPSDQYAIESQVKFHGFDPEDAIIQVGPDEGQHTISPEKLVNKIRETGDELALVLIGGVNFYTGQAFDMETITREGHKAGALVGFDLAHAAGNLKLQLHDWNVDFASWCSYKYLNSGPGSVSGCFIHERHCKNKDLPRFAGWWGTDKKERFKMEKHFKPMKTAEAWQLSNAPVFSMAAHKAALDIFDEAGMDALCNKSEKLTDYCEFLINEINQKIEKNQNKLEIITPSDKNQRGCQLSIIAHGRGHELFDALSEKGVVADWREPNVIRIAPVPLYNSFYDVYRFGRILKEVL